MNRKLAIALAISVALNLFLLGFMSARAMRRPDGPPRLGPSASARPDRPGPGMGPGMRKGPGMGSGPGMGRGMGPGMRKGPGPHRPGMGGPPLGRRGPGAADGGAGVAAGRVLRHAERMSDDPKVAAVLEANRERVRAQRQATRAARRAVHDALLAEPFDRAALERAFAELREQRAQAQAAAHATVVELADKLGPEERRKLARRGRGDGRRRGRMPMMSEREAGSDSDSDSDSVTDTVSDSVTDTVSVTVSGCWKGGVPGVGECAGLKQLAL